MTNFDPKIWKKKNFCPKLRLAYSYRCSYLFWDFSLDVLIKGVLIKWNRCSTWIRFLAFSEPRFLTAYVVFLSTGKGVEIEGWKPDFWRQWCLVSVGSGTWAGTALARLSVVFCPHAHEEKIKEEVCSKSNASAVETDLGKSTKTSPAHPRSGIQTNRVLELWQFGNLRQSGRESDSWSKATKLRRNN